MSTWKKYLLWFAQEHVNFRHAEVQSILNLTNIPYRALNIKVSSKLPFCSIELPNDDAAITLASRSVALRCILELWSHTNSIECLHKNLKCYINENIQEFQQKYFNENLTFKLTVETYNKHFSQNEKIDKIETFNYLPIKGSVSLKHPNIEYYYIEYYGLDPVNVPEQPFDVFFGKWVSDGNRSLITDLSLKKRKFIGNTSMDAQLSLLMANQALVKRGDLVFDPFVGTGSLLVAAAKFGGYVLGCDIDYLMLHGKTRPTRIKQKVREKDESIRANLKQYNCDSFYLDVLVSDFSKSIWNSNILFDSIITDPPYGIREATEKVDFKEHKKPDSRDETSIHFPSTSHYSLTQIYNDLINFSVKHLKIGGRLVCWIPIFKNDYNDEMIPKHNCLKLVYNCEQNISALTSRRLLTYEKIISDTSIESSDKPVIIDDFRNKFFSYTEESRQKRRIERAELREIGRQEALNRGKILDENGKVCSLK